MPAYSNCVHNPRAPTLSAKTEAPECLLVLSKA